MDLSTIFATGYLLLNTAAMIGLGILLWNAFRRRRDPEALLHARKATERHSAGRGHRPA